LAGWTIVLGNYFSVFATGLDCVVGSRRAAARQLAMEISIRVKVFLSNFALLYYVKKKLLFIVKIELRKLLL